MVFERSLQILGVGLLIVSSQSTVSADQRFLLSPARNSSYQARVAFDVRGHLKVGTGREAKRLPMSVAGKLAYRDEVVHADHGRLRFQANREFTTASAKITVDGNAFESRLRPDRRFIALNVADKITRHSIGGPLSREELDLIAAQGDGLLLNALLPGRAVEIDSSWQHSHPLAALLLSLDSVSQSDMVSRLRQVEDNVAIVELTGTVHGAVDGIATEIELRGKYNFDLESHQVTWLALTIKEDRSIGPAEPGFDVTARFRIALGPVSEPSRSTAVDKSPVPGDLRHAQKLVLQGSPGTFELHYEPRWRVLVESADLHVLRMVEAGEPVAQCNIRRFRTPEKKLTADSFKQDIKQALGDACKDAATRTEEIRDDGTRLLCVSASGESGKVPLRWIYYHIEQGELAYSIVFTLQEAMIQKFGDSDVGIVESFRILLPNTTPVDSTPRR